MRIIIGRDEHIRCDHEGCNNEVLYSAPQARYYVDHLGVDKSIDLKDKGWFIDGGYCPAHAHLGIALHDEIVRGGVMWRAEREAEKLLAAEAFKAGEIDDATKIAAQEILRRAADTADSNAKFREAERAKRQAELARRRDASAQAKQALSDLRR